MDVLRDCIMCRIALSPLASFDCVWALDEMPAIACLVAADWSLSLRCLLLPYYLTLSLL